MKIQTPDNKDRITHMRKVLYALASLIIAGTSCTKAVQENGLMVQEEQSLMTKLVGGSEGDIVPGTLLVRLNADADKAVFAEMGVTSLVPAIPFKPKNEAVARKYGLDQWYIASFDTEKRPQDMATEIAKVQSVCSIQYDRYLEAVRSEEYVPLAESMMPVTKAGSGDMFDDPYAVLQWNLVNDGTIASGAMSGADVNVRDAWKLTAGDSDLIVAVFDDAINYNHEDLKEAVWINAGEIKGNGTDDDGNGFIDDVYGFNFVQCTQATDALVEDKLNSGSGPQGIKGKELDFYTGIGHGTHVAGIVGATNGNGKGVSSIAGGSGNGDGVRLMSCQIFQGTGTSAKNATDAQCAMAYIYAADNGACIAQCSYGQSNVITSDNDYINGKNGVMSSRLENLALQYFLDPANSNHESLEGNIAVFASGNHQSAYSSYPGALSYVLSVTAFGYDLQPAGYTNYGPGCKIAAPGGEWKEILNDYSGMILSTGVSAKTNPYPGVITDNGTENKNYTYMQGTSMACPHVSGIIALGLSYAKKLGKRFTRVELTSLLLTSVNDIDQFNSGKNTVFYPPFSQQGETIDMNRFKGQMGTGAVDAWKFLMAIEGTPTLLVQAGKKMSMDISRYCNPDDDYTITVDQATRTSLGLSSDPVIRGGKLEIECSNVGSGKIVLSGKVGKDPAKEDGIGNMSYSRTLSVASRPFATNNGGWL